MINPEFVLVRTLYAATTMQFRERFTAVVRQLLRIVVEVRAVEPASLKRRKILVNLSVIRLGALNAG